MTDEWKVVQSKQTIKKQSRNTQQQHQQQQRRSEISKKSKKTHNSFTQSIALNKQDNDNINIDEYLNRFHLISQFLRETKFFTHCLEILSSHYSNHLPRLVILGIGNFTTSPSACLQLSLGLELFSQQNQLSQQQHHHRHHIYDPLLTSVEVEICQRLGLMINNSLSIHEADSLTLFYMPHCPYSLYNKILWSNWGQNLEKIMILGNSFQSYSLRRIEDMNSTTSTRSDCMKILHNIIDEREVWKNEFRNDEILKRCPYFELHSLENAFNDTSLMHFLKDFDHRIDLLGIENRPSERDMMTDLENDLELIHQEIR